MSLGPLLALAAGFWLLSSNKKKGATVRVHSREPESVTRELEKQLPVFTEEQVFGPREVKQVEPLPIVDAPPTSSPQPVPAVPEEMQRQEEQVFDAMPIEPGPVAVEQVPAPVQSDSPEPVQVEDVEPVVTAQPEVVQTNPRRAAEELAAYVRANRGKGAKLGTKGKPSDTVRALQLQMGEEPADGIYGPSTRKRGEELGVSMPPRG